MKIANKISLSFLAVTLILVGTAGAIVYIIVKDNLQKSIYNNLATAVASRANHIETYLEMLEMSVGQLSKSTILENLLEIKDKEDSRRNEAFQQAMRRLKRTKEVNPSIFEFLLLDATGKVIASNNESNIGADKSTDAFFLGGQKEAFIKDVYYSQSVKEPLIAVSAPFLDSNTGELLGVIVARVRLNELNSIVKDRTGLGETGEIYIVNKYGFMITPSRFTEDAVLKQRVDTENVRRVRFHKGREHVLSEDEMAHVFPDYRGLQVLGSHTFIPRMQWAVLAEINAKEAFAPLAELRLVIFFILFTAVNTAWLLGIYIARFISEPLHRLHKGTEIIGNGNLDYKVGTDAKDEVGQLSRAFDAMTENLKNTTTSIESLNKEVAERKRVEGELRESEAKYHGLFESSHDAIMILEPPLWNFTSGNPATIKLFGCKDEKEFLSLTPADSSPEYQPDGTASSVKAQEMIKTAMEKGNHFFEWMHKRMDKTEFPATVLLTRTEIKGKKVLQATVRDITESKKAEKEMKEAVEMKVKFVSTASHELRTPLTAIKQGINLVHSETTGPLNDNQKEFLGIAKNNVDRLARLINDVLDLQKITAGRMAFDMKPASINEAVTLVEETMRPLAKEKGLELIIELDQAIPAVNFDKDKIIQVLTNLINNAIKFTETGGIKVTTSRNDNNIITSVKDSGCGIKQEDIPRLFQEFEQLATADSERTTGGTGLGLAISKKIIENHGGKIWAESDYGKGTTFYFELPMEAIPCQIES
ncbi:MAG: ATP-binding protein [Sedimentisphaerales bacterium]